MTHLPRLLVPASLGSLALLGLTGCSGAASPGSGASSPSPAASSSAPAASSLTDGRYSALGRYRSPGGASAVDVDLTLKDGVVTALTVTPKAENPTAQQYESRFASGIDAQAVGKRITELNVSKVSGSSLTSKGFDAAIAAIEEKAR